MFCVILAASLMGSGLISLPAGAAGNAAAGENAGQENETRIEFESVKNSISEKDGKTYVGWTSNPATISAVTAAAGGKVVDSTKNGDVFYFGEYDLGDLKTIRVTAGTTQTRSKIAFYAVDLSQHSLDSVTDQSSASALLKHGIPLGESGNLTPGSSWNDFKDNDIPVAARLSGSYGLFAQTVTPTTFCGNFDYFILRRAEPDVTPDPPQWRYGLGEDQGFYESKYSPITKNEYSKTYVNQWRDGSMTGNGTMGIIESADPAEDVFIFNHTKLVLGSNDVRETPNVAGKLETIRKNVVSRNNPGAWTGWVSDWRKENYGVSTLSSNTFMYHPAAELRIKNNNYTAHDEYNRYTNWETGEIGVQWKDQAVEYNSRTFISRPDNVAVTIIEAPEGKTLDLTLSVDNLLEMNIDSAPLVDKGIMIAPESKEIITKDERGYSIGQIVKYGDFNIGMSNIPHEYAKSGYATAVRVVTDGEIAAQSKSETKTVNRLFNTNDKNAAFEKEITTPYLNVSNTGQVMLITKVDRQDEGEFTDVRDLELDADGLADLSSVACYQSLLGEVDSVLTGFGEIGASHPGLSFTAMSCESGEASVMVENTGVDPEEVTLYAANFNEDGTLREVAAQTIVAAPGKSEALSITDSRIKPDTRLFVWDSHLRPVLKAKTSLNTVYDTLLSRHAAEHRELFCAATLDLHGSEEDRRLTNSALQEKQNQSDEINPAWLERLYHNGRFALICASGYNTTRLGGIWTGSWMPDWSGDFTQDANVNLQISSMNVGNLKPAAHAYMTYILRQVSDWEINAKNVYGIDNAIMAGPRTDGDGNGQIYHSLQGYPFLYWNTGADWLLVPVFEYWQCYGNDTIPVGEDLDFTELKRALDLADGDVERIKAEGFDLEQDILKPLITKLYHFWQGYVDEGCYMDENGDVHVYDGTTMGENDRYLFAPGYSPENVPAENGAGYNGTPSLAYNATMDISAAHDSMKMVRELIENGVITDITAGEAAGLEEKFPECKIAEDGALKEWASEDLEEHYNHRHVSHTYAAWPGYEAFGNDSLSGAIADALDMRYAYNLTDNAQAHGHLHNALVEARIGRQANYEEQLHYLIANSYQYQTLMTSHNHRHGSAFCTDNASGLCGVVNEALIYSDTGLIQILPTLIDSLSSGKITGMTARAQTKVDELVWDLNAGTAAVKLTSTKEGVNAVRLACGRKWDSVEVSGCEYAIVGDELHLQMKQGVQVSIAFRLGKVSDGTYELKNGSQYLAPESYAEGAAAVELSSSEPWNVSVTGNEIRIVSQVSGRTLCSDGRLKRGGQAVWPYDGNAVTINGNKYTLNRIASKNTGVVADSFQIAVNDTQETVDLIGSGGAVHAGKAVKFRASEFVPVKAKINDVVWRVEATDGTPLTSTVISGGKDYSNNKTWYSDAVLNIGTDALGKTLKVYAETPDGSCRSANTVTINVAFIETVSETVESENISYGFGSYKIETNSKYSHSGAIGTVSGKAVLKYKAVNFEKLLSVELVRSLSLNPAKVTAYYDLAEKIADEAVYWDSYNRDSGEGKGGVSRRYTIEEVEVSAQNQITDSVSVKDGSERVVLSKNAGVGGTHDLYLVIEPNGQTWAGNYDYMSLVYEK